MKSEKITIRINEDLKRSVNLLATNNNQSMSEFILEAVKDRVELVSISESQAQFIELFKIAFESSYEKYFKQLMLVLNRNCFNSQWLLKQNDLFYKHLKIPQTRDEIKTSFSPHPITDIAKEILIKEIHHGKGGLHD